MIIFSDERIVEAQENRYSAIISADLDDVTISSGLAELSFSLDGVERRATLRFLNVRICRVERLQLAARQ